MNVCLINYQSENIVGLNYFVSIRLIYYFDSFLDFCIL